MCVCMRVCVTVCVYINAVKNTHARGTHGVIITTTAITERADYTAAL